MATRRKRARNADGTLKGDDKSTPNVNEAWEVEAAAEEAAPEATVEETQAPEEAPAVEAPTPEAEAPVAIENPPEAEVPSAAPLADMLADKRKDPEKQEADPGLKPMTEERLAEIRASAITPAAVEKAEVDKIIESAGVEKTRGREIAARLMYNARRNGGFI